MPKVITPPGGNTQKPANTTLVQIGFTHELNYAFVSSNPASASQIFTYLPSGVKFGLQVPKDSQDSKDTRMYNIQPYDTSKTMGYITTLALMYVASDMVNQLAVDLHTPNSPLYNNPDPTIATLMSFINPAIPLIAGQPMDGTALTTGPAASSASAGAAGGGAPFGGDSQNSEKVKTSAVALGLPIAAGVVLYGAAMALVARRYRKRKGAHRRTSSLNSDPAWMSGAGSVTARNSHGSGSSQGRSIRTQQISAPVMAGNSLGWN
ncbi:hypothetical protein EJ08DRAFT_588359 [Tothia fuscella]|uniref:Uncharacterized protein n=1 Tax=Tothia fuscella TaxID=1048955 RepID=A0A9P4TYW8_9PEZI|nr:hypothetical protein EJ08DRAFT_588359 [Tothia fuscella]